MTTADATLIAELFGTTHRMTRMAGKLLGDAHGVTHFRTLGLLRQFGPSRIGEIAALERISQPGATKLVAALEAEGFASRSADPADGRAMVISATPAGLAALDAWTAAVADVLVPRFGELTDADRAALTRTIALVHASLDS